MAAEAPVDAPPRPGPAWLWANLVGAAGGVGIALYLTRLHLDLFYGKGVAESFCDFGGPFDCSTVNGSAQSELFGIPHALLAIPTYACLGVLAFLVRREGRGSAAAGLYALITTATVLYSGWLVGVSATVIHAWCVLCLGLDAINVLLAVLAWRAAGAGLGRVFTAPRVFGVTAAAFLVPAALAWGGYTHSRDTLVAEATKVALQAPAPAKATKLAGAVDPEGGPTTKNVKFGEARAEIEIPKDAPALGPKNAKVTIVEFSDFLCPYCKRLSGTLRQAVEEYPKDVRLVYMDFALNPECNPAMEKKLHADACAFARVGRCANKQGHFWEAYDTLFAEQGQFKLDELPTQLANELKLDVAAMNTCVGDAGVLAAIQRDGAAGGKVGVSGTPTFFINGRLLTGAQPIEVVRAVIDAELAGQTGALDLQVDVGTEQIGMVEGATADVAISALPGGARIDSFEATLEGNRAVSRAGAPVARGVSWYEAKSACEASGRRLCTEQEWLAACTGAVPMDIDHNGVYSDNPVAGRPYAYGTGWRSGVCADTRNPTAPGDLIAGNHPRCATPDGIYDLHGNVKEWVGLTPTRAAVKGGSFSSAESARCAYLRTDVMPAAHEDSVGFRCCSGPAPTEPPASIRGPLVGDTFPEFQGTLLAGGATGSKQLAGKPTIVTFWASWCGPCRKEMPALSALYTKYKDRGLQVLGVSVDKTAEAAQGFLTATPMAFPIALDGSNTLQRQFGAESLPTTFWVGTDGKVWLRTTGLPPGGDRRLDELVQELVSGGKAPVPPPPTAAPPG